MTGESERVAFRRRVFERDEHTCRGCGATDRELDAHHILDRSLMPAAGYVPENGISLCRDDCHALAERYHRSGGTDWVDGFHPDELFARIGSSRKTAIAAARERARELVGDRTRRSGREYPGMAVGAFWTVLPEPGDDAESRIDWQALKAACPWLHELDLCPQDPVHHQEGDVGRHTRLVFDALRAQEDFAGLPAEDREVLMIAVLLHDVAKPASFWVEEGERITAHNHARRGACMARDILWRRGYDSAKREQVCALIANHMRAFHLIHDDPVKARSKLVRMSQTVRLDLLYQHAFADASGREAPDKQASLDNVELFRELAREEGVLDGPYVYPSARQGFLHHRNPGGRQPESPGDGIDDDAPWCVVLCGLPGSGKDTFVRQHLDVPANTPEISLDAIRLEKGIRPTDEQGAVIQEAFERARAQLRKGRGFVWNATNLTPDVRGKVIDLIYRYGGRSRVVHVEAAYDVAHTRNRNRRDVVPEDVLDRMTARWEPPMPHEGDVVEYYVDDGNGPRYVQMPGLLRRSHEPAPSPTPTRGSLHV